MNMIRKKNLLLFTLIGFLAILWSCDDSLQETQNGRVSLALTDAPIDDENLAGVFITITGIEYKKGNGQWQTFEEFEGPQEFNLMELTNGDTAMLGEFNSGAGNYTGLRFLLEASERGEGPKSTPGCYLLYKDSTQQPLFVPSGGQTGYKAVGSFSVPANGNVEVTADFDARKSVVKAGKSGKYLLKPTIRLIVNNQAGSISGRVNNRADTLDYTVYAYEQGAYEDSEADEPEEESNRFPNATSSSGVEEDGSYQLSFLAEGEYELVVGASDEEGEFEEVTGSVDSVAVESNANTTLDIDLEDL